MPQASCRLQAIVILTLEPERLKNRLATTRKIYQRWKGSSPETLKRLVISVFLRRSFLPSSTESDGRNLAQQLHGRMLVPLP